MIPVALRSEDPQLIETVRSILAVSSIPLTVLPTSATEPVRAGLALDHGQGEGTWKGEARRYAKVGLRNAGPWGQDVLQLPQEAKELLSLARAANRVHRATVIAVVGAAGGVGASVFASGLAREAALAGLSVALVEGQGNPALGSLLGLEHEPGLRWADLPAAGTEPGYLTSSLPRWQNVRVLLGDHRSHPPLGQMDGPVLGLAQTNDLIVVDVQRHELKLGFVRRWCDHVLLITTPAPGIVGAAAVIAGGFKGESAHLIVRGPARSGLSGEEISDDTALPVLATMRDERSLPGAIDRGFTPGDHRRGPLVRAVKTTIKQLGVGQ